MLIWAYGISKRSYKYSYAHMGAYGFLAIWFSVHINPYRRPYAYPFVGNLFKLLFMLKKRSFWLGTSLELPLYMRTCILMGDVNLNAKQFNKKSTIFKSNIHFLLRWYLVLHSFSCRFFMHCLFLEVEGHFYPFICVMAL